MGGWIWGGDPAGMASVEVRSVRKSAALRPRGPGKLQPARSMPLDYRYSAAGGRKAANGVGARAAVAPEEEEEEGVEVGVVGFEGDADSPYSSQAATTEEVEEEGDGERGGGDAEVDSAAAATGARATAAAAAATTPRRQSPAGAGSPSQRDARWGDTSSYGARKVDTFPLL